MKILTVANQKGGCGKSTVCLNVATAAERSGQRVLIVELDQQGSISQWAERRQAETPVYAVAKTADELARVLDTGKRSGFTLAVIDTPGHLSANVESAIQQADFVLIPVRPSRFDLDATAATVRTAKDARRKIGFVISQAPAQQQRILEIASAVSSAAPVAPVALGSRMDYADSVRDGQSVTELNSSGKAAQEIAVLWNWIEGQING